MKSKTENKIAYFFADITKSKNYLSIVLFVVITFIAAIYALNRDERSASEILTPKSAALHLFHDEFNQGILPGVAHSDYVIPKAVLDGDFTVRFSLKNGEYNYLSGGNDIFAFEGNGTNNCQYSHPNRRVYFMTDASPNTHMEFYTNPCTKMAGERTQTRTIQTYDDYFLVYKKPIPGEGGSDGYYRVYRAFDKNESIIPQGMDTLKYSIDMTNQENPNNLTLRCSGTPQKCFYYERYLSYTIDKNTVTDWQGNDTHFRLVVGDKDVNKQDIRATEFTMWTRALDSDMGIDPNEPSYYAPYYSNIGTFQKFQSNVLNALTHNALNNMPAEYKNDLYFHFGASDSGLANNIWKNTAPNAPLGIDIGFEGAASLSSAVPDWPGSNYPSSSNLLPLVSEDFDIQLVGNDTIKIVNIPQGIPQSNASGMELRRQIYLSKTKENYKYSALDRKVIADVETELIFSGLDLAKNDYHVTVEWIDKLENVTRKTKTHLGAPTLAPSVSSIRINESSGTFTNVQTSLASKLPINIPYTFRINFKALSLQEGETIIYSVRDYGYKGDYVVFKLSVVTTSGVSKLKAAVFDGIKQINFSSNAEISINVWEEVWVTFEHPTSQNSGQMNIYKKNTSETLDNVLSTSLPVVWGWYTDRTYMKWETKIFFGGCSGCVMTNKPGTDFLIGQSTWWTKALPKIEIDSMVGTDIGLLPRDVRQNDYLFWNMSPDLVGTELVPSLNSPPSLKQECYMPTGEIVPCILSDDAPIFSNTSDNLYVIIENKKSMYVGKRTTLSPLISPVAKYFAWTKEDSKPGLIIYSPQSSSTEIESNVPTGSIDFYKIKITASSDTGSAEKLINIHVHKLADINGDNSINFTDFSTLLSSWGTPANPMANIIREGASATKVDFQDFSVLLSKWGELS